MQPQEAKPRGAGSVTAIRPFQIRGRFFTAIALRLASRPDDEMLAALDAQLRQTPGFFAGAPMVLDLEQASAEVRGDDLAALVEQLRKRKLSVFAVQNGTPEQTAAGVGAGLIALSGGRDVPSRTSGKEPAPTAAAAPVEAPPPENRLITTPVRSGQTVFADRGDLTVVGPVGSGAELLAAGSIHVYGPLRGRALAGVNGDQGARIFCHSLDAELLAIAGLYRTSESLGPDVRRRSVQAFLSGEQLCVEPLEQNPTRDRSDP